MATYQTTYSETFAAGVAGMIANTEPYNHISRTAEEAIEFGQPAYKGSALDTIVAGATFAATGAGSAAAGNVGTGVITSAPAITAGAKAGRYQAILLATSATAAYAVYDPDGVLVGHGNVASANTTIPGITTFTITNAGTMTIGDTYYIDVSFDENAKFEGLTIRDPVVPADASNPDRYPQYATASVMDFGTMWVTAGGSVARGGLVYWNPSTKRYTATTTHVLIPGAEFMDDGSNGSLVRVKLRRIPGL